jgi:SH3-like domain-containing protein
MFSLKTAGPMRRTGMNRLLLFLWLLGAALYGANTLIYTNAIFGWPTSRQSTDAAKQPAKPNDAVAARSRQGVDSSQNNDPIETVAADRWAVPPSTQSQDPGRQQEIQPTLVAQPEITAAPQPVSPQEQQAQPAAAQGERVKVLARGATMRAGPSASTRPLASLSPGEELPVVSREKGWVQVSNGASTGWIYEGLLASTGLPTGQAAAGGSAKATPKPLGQSELMKVSDASAHVRASPSEAAPMLFAFPRGRQVRAISRQPGWVQVVDTASSATGWIAEPSLTSTNVRPREANAEASKRPRKAIVDAQRSRRDAPPSPAAKGRGPMETERLAWEEEMRRMEAGLEPQDGQRFGSRRKGRLGIFRRSFGGL